MLRALRTSLGRSRRIFLGRPALVSVDVNAVRLLSDHDEPDLLAGGGNGALDGELDHAFMEDLKARTNRRMRRAGYPQVVTVGRGLREMLSGVGLLSAVRYETLELRKMRATLEALVSAYEKM